MSSSTAQVFGTPFYRMQVGHEPKLDQLRDYLLARQSKDDENPSRPQGAHQSVFESRFDLFSRKDGVIVSLKDKLYTHLMQYLSEVNGFDQSTLGGLKFRQESWYHITEKGGYFQAHTHPRASVSMIYCVDPGEEGLMEREQGNVLFYDPRFNASMHLDVANRHMRREFSFDGIRFRLSKDEVCIFPSYLQHSVEPYAGNQPRITVAANFTF